MRFGADHEWGFLSPRRSVISFLRNDVAVFLPERLDIGSQIVHKTSQIYGVIGTYVRFRGREYYVFRRIELIPSIVGFLNEKDYDS